jgi:hypothetical protein
MNKLLLGVLFVFLSCATGDSRLETFNTRLGEDKANDLTKLSVYFSSYLSDSYPELSNFNLRFGELLSDLKEYDYKVSNNIKLQDSISNEVISIYQLSGLKKDLWIRVKEFDSIYNVSEEIFVSDSTAFADTIESYQTNIYSDYHIGLSSFLDDKFIADYLDARNMMGDISLPVMIDEFIYRSNQVDYNDPILKRIVTLEIFVPIAYQSIKK